jgi:acetyl esterase
MSSTREVNAHEVQGIMLEPETRQFLDALAASGSPEIYELAVPDAREVLRKAQAGPVEKAPADVEDRTIPVGPR